MGDAISWLIGFGCGVMLTVYLAAVDCEDFSLSTPFGDFVCTPTDTGER